MKKKHCKMDCRFKIRIERMCITIIFPARLKHLCLSCSVFAVASHDISNIINTSHWKRLFFPFSHLQFYIESRVVTEEKKTQTVFVFCIQSNPIANGYFLPHFKLLPLFAIIFISLFERRQ